MDRTGRTDDRPDQAFMPAQPLLVSPVRADALANRRFCTARLAIEHQFAGDASDARIGEGSNQCSQRIRGKGLPCVREHENIVRGSSDTRIEGARLTP